jgi:hypothetical protein
MILTYIVHKVLFKQFILFYVTSRRGSAIVGKTSRAQCGKWTKKGFYMESVKVIFSPNFLFSHPDRNVDIKDNQLGIKLIPMISTWDQFDPIFPGRTSDTLKSRIDIEIRLLITLGCQKSSVKVQSF